MIPANAPAYNSHYSGLGRALCRGFISYTLFLALVRDEVVARASEMSRRTEEEENDVALSLGHGQGETERC